METYSVKKITNLLAYDHSHLVEESKADGFRFVERLAVDYQNATNSFGKPGENLFGVFNEYNDLIAIGGLNIDPYSNNQEVGRLRRFYVSKKYRRKGIGRLLLKKIILEAEHFFKMIVLRTDTEEASQFYCAHGFSKKNTIAHSTHCLIFKKRGII